MIQTIIISDRTMQAFSWMLIHSLWQGLLLAIGAGIVLMLTRRSSAAVRYNLTLVLFSFFLLASVSTFTYEWNAIPVQHEQISNSQPVRHELNKDGTENISFTGTVNSYVSQQSNSAASYNIKAYIQTFNNYFSRNSSLIVLLWFIFFIAKSVSMAGNMLYLQRARHYQIYAPSEYWKDKVSSLCEKLQLKRAVLLFESGYVKVPVVIGYLKPIILLPVGLIAGLPEAQVEAVLLHELAHIRRNDYVINFLQNIAEAVFFFNPGLLWISAMLKEERENCCDDIALEQTQNKEQFIQALISFKEYFLSNSTPAVAVAFPGQKNHLLNRVMRIVYQRNKTFSMKESGTLIVGIVAIALMAFTTYQVKDYSKPVKALSSIKSKNGNIDFKQELKTLTGSESIILKKGVKIVKENLDNASRNISDGINKDSEAEIGITAVNDLESFVEIPLVIIDNSQYDPKNLYRISQQSIEETSVFPPGKVVNKFDIKTKNDRTSQFIETTNISPDEMVRIVARRFQDNFYNRVAFKNTKGDLFDIIVINRPGGGKLADWLNHDAKAAFIMDGTLHEESEIANLSKSQISTMMEGYRTSRVGPAKSIEGLNTSEYSIYFSFYDKVINQMAIKSD